MNIAGALEHALVVLDSSDVPQPVRESSLLMQFALQKDRAFLVAHPEYVLTDSEISSFQDVLNRRAAHEPFQYIVGNQEFYGLDFAVTPAVLIPRPETEMLVAKAVQITQDLTNLRFLEIGIGSGCISVSILKNAPGAVAVGVDLSDTAIAVARSNAAKHGVLDRLLLQESDVFTDLPDARYDLIVSNPPYVPSDDLPGLQPEVRDHEPLSALSDGGDGLSIIRRIIEGAPDFLKPGGYLLIEIGFKQADDVKKMIDPSIWASAGIEPDFQGIPRMVVARMRTFSRKEAYEEVNCLRFGSDWS